jgi:signal peptidase I
MSRYQSKLLRAAWIGGILILVVPLAIYAIPHFLGGYQSYIILSGSMTPTLHEGDAVIVHQVPPSDIEKGDIITFEDGESYITHRVVGINKHNGSRSFETKGDSNDQPDPGAVPAASVVGHRFVSIPYIGHIILFTRTQIGMVLFIAVPFGLLFVSESKNLFSYYQAYTSSKKETDKQESHSTEANDQRQQTNQPVTQPTQSPDKQFMFGNSKSEDTIPEQETLETLQENRQRKIDELHATLSELEDGEKQFTVVASEVKSKYKYLGALEVLEDQLNDGTGLYPTHSGVQRAAAIADIEPEQVIVDLKDRNPDLAEQIFIQST